MGLLGGGGTLGGGTLDDSDFGGPIVTPPGIPSPTGLVIRTPVASSQLDTFPLLPYDRTRGGGTITIPVVPLELEGGGTLDLEGGGVLELEGGVISGITQFRAGAVPFA